jgi:DNA invertase Pin-like site-specific DNA recombinase
MLMNILAIFAEFELDLIHERTTGGFRRYRELYRQGRVGKHGNITAVGNAIPRRTPRADLRSCSCRPE